MVRLGIVAPEFRGADVGYGLRVDRWGQGLTDRAVRLVIGFGFEQLGLHRIVAVCDPNNVGSRRVMEKVGMQPEGRLRQDMRSQGRVAGLARLRDPRRRMACVGEAPIRARH